MRKIDPKLLERVRKSLQKKRREKRCHREWMKASGGNPDSPYEPLETLVFAAAVRIQNNERRRKLVAAMVAERREITQLYASYRRAKSRKPSLALRLIPLITKRIEDIEKRFGFYCHSRPSDVEGLYAEMLGHEGHCVAVRLARP